MSLTIRERLSDIGFRMIYWTAVIGINWMIVDALLAAIPATGVVAIANALSGIGWPQHLFELLVKVTFLLVAISMPAFHWRRRRPDFDAIRSPHAADNQPSAASAAEQTPSAFAARLNRCSGEPLLCLEMQDHYLIVHALNHSEMILCRMEDAARELSAHGVRVHRSWWVAHDAVERVERRNQRPFFRLCDGREVPVGRSYRAHLSAMGWL